MDKTRQNVKDVQPGDRFVEGEVMNEEELRALMLEFLQLYDNKFVGDPGCKRKKVSK